MAYNNSKLKGYWDNNENIRQKMSEFTTDKLISSFKISEPYQNNIRVVEIECENGYKRTVNWNVYKRYKSKCNCEDCKLSKDRSKNKWDSFWDYQNYFSKFGLESYNTPDSMNDSVYCWTKDGYRVLASVSNLMRSERNNKTPSFDIFGIRNKYQFNNLQLWILKNRPDYKLIDNCKLYPDNISVKDFIYLKYIGSNLKGKYCRYFKTTIDLFVNGNVGHPNLTISKGEMKVKDYLDINKIDYKMQYTDKNCKDKIVLRFDFAIFDKNKLIGLVEFDGAQHEKEIKWWTKSAFIDLKKRDLIKNDFCKNNSIPLLRIKYNEIKLTDEKLKFFIDDCKRKEREEV
jgi:hypothetical protein